MGRIVGLDIGSTAVRGVEVRNGRSSSAVSKTARIPLPRGAVVKGEIVNAAAVTDALKELRTKGRFGTKNAAIGYASENLITRMVDTEWMPYAEAKKAMRYEMEDYVDLGSTEVIHDIHVVRTYDVEERGRAKRMMTVILTASDAHALERVADTVAAAGFAPVRIEPSPLAAIRAMRPDPAEQRGIVLIDIGASNTTVAVHVGGQPVFVRVLPGVGGDAVTDALHKEFDGWTWEEAEATKIALGLPAELVPARPSFSVFEAENHQRADTHPAVFVISSVMEGVFGHLRESLEHVTSRSGIAIEKVQLLGGGSLMSGLPARLSSSLGLPASLADIGIEGSTDPELPRNTLIVAAGLGTD